MILFSNPPPCAGHVASPGEKVADKWDDFTYWVKAHSPCSKKCCKKQQRRRHPTYAASGEGTRAERELQAADARP